MDQRNCPHLLYFALNLNQSIRFYCGKLGLKQAFDFVNDQGKRFGVYIHVGDRTFIELFQGEIGAAAAPAYRHFCLEVDHLEMTVAGLRTADIEVSEPKLGGDGSWQAWLADPDGNRIELHQYMPGSKQSKALEGVGLVTRAKS